MTYEEFEKAIKKVLPEASIDTDNEGQIVIYTNLMLQDKGDGVSEVVEFEPPE